MTHQFLKAYAGSEQNSGRRLGLSKVSEEPFEQSINYSSPSYARCVTALHTPPVKSAASVESTSSSSFSVGGGRSALRAPAPILRFRNETHSGEWSRCGVSSEWSDHWVLMLDSSSEGENTKQFLIFDFRKNSLNSFRRRPVSLRDKILPFKSFYATQLRSHQQELWQSDCILRLIGSFTGVKLWWFDTSWSRRPCHRERGWMSIEHFLSNVLFYWSAVCSVVVCWQFRKVHLLAF